MTAAEPLQTIGEVARRCGLSVKTIRFYSDGGLVPPAGRTEAGYRLYDEAGVARLELVRTLRDLGIDLATIRRILARELTVAEVAGAHAAALDAQIGVLQLRRRVLGAVARRQLDPKEIDLMHKLARLSAEERQRILDEFLDHVFDGLDVDPGLAQRMRATRPELPEDPTQAQLDAWIELAELVRDDDFRRRVRGMAERGSAERAQAPPRPADPQGIDALVRERAGKALADGVDPAGPAARPVVDELVGAMADANATADDPAFRARLAETIDAFADARVERYWQLLGTINGWPSRPAGSPAWVWLMAALRAPAAA